MYIKTKEIMNFRWIKKKESLFKRTQTKPNNKKMHTEAVNPDK